MSVPDKPKRLSIDLTVAEHQRLKRRALDSGKSLRDYVLGCLEQCHDSVSGSTQPRETATSDLRQRPAKQRGQ